MPPIPSLTPGQRAFIAALTIAELRDETLWRPGHFDLPVLRRLPRLELEIGDRDARREEPPPFPIIRGGSPEASTYATEPEWWEVAYPGGPMVAVKGFPRSLYPPDAANQGKTPSVDGPDVIAYKRTISRAGRWPWSSPFDDSFSNAFAHGKSGNVSETGVAGVQRQGGIEPDSGWIGTGTFNLLRSIRIPAGLPNAGQPAMDQVAVELINDAYQKFQAKPPSQSIDDVREAIVDLLVRSIRATRAWHYSQVRAMQNLGVKPELDQRADCSTSSTDAYFWARLQTGLAVPDPNHSGFNGFGWTGTLVQNPEVGLSARHEIGDLGIYGRNRSDTTHVVTCYVPGVGSASEWCSHGSESAPYPVELRYRRDLLCVVRPGLLA